MTKARKEAVNVVYEFQAKKEIPKIAIIPDRSSSHAVVYRLEEMNPDEIAEAFNEAGATGTTES